MDKQCGKIKSCRKQNAKTGIMSQINTLACAAIFILTVHNICLNIDCISFLEIACLYIDHLACISTVIKDPIATPSGEIHHNTQVHKYKIRKAECGL